MLEEGEDSKIEVESVFLDLFGGYVFEEELLGFVGF